MILTISEKKKKCTPFIRFNARSNLQVRPQQWNLTKFQIAAVSVTSHVTVQRGVIGQVVMVVVNKLEQEIRMKPMKRLSHVTVKISVSSMWWMILMRNSKRVLFKTADRNDMHSRKWRHNRWHYEKGRHDLWMGHQHTQGHCHMLSGLLFRVLINSILILRLGFLKRKENLFKLSATFAKIFILKNFVKSGSFLL